MTHISILTGQNRSQESFFLQWAESNTATLQLVQVQRMGREWECLGLNVIFLQPSCLYDLKKISKKDCKKQKSRRTAAKLCLFRHDRTATLMNSHCLWLTTQIQNGQQTIQIRGKTWEGPPLTEKLLTTDKCWGRRVCFLR